MQAKIITYNLPGGGTSLVAPMVKRLSTMRETWVWSLGRENPLEKEMAIHSSAIAWKIPWTEEPDRLQSMGSQRVRHDWATSLILAMNTPCSFCEECWLHLKGGIVFVNLTPDHSQKKPFHDLAAGLTLSLSLLPAPTLAWITWLVPA